MRVYLYFHPTTRQVLAYGTSILPISGNEGVDWSVEQVEILQDNPIWDSSALQSSSWYYLENGSFTDVAP